MIQIALMGGMLDVPAQEISSSFASMRFADVIPDTYTTDIDLPRTAHNVALLGAYGELDRGQMFGRRIACFISSDTINSDGYLTVNRLTETTITITVYYGIIAEPFDRPIRELVTDSGMTAYFKMDKYYSASHSISNVSRYDFYASLLAQAPNIGVAQPFPPYSNNGYPLPPCVQVKWLLSQIGNAVGITLPYLNDDLLYIVAKEFKQTRNTPSVWTFHNDGSSLTTSTQLGVSFNYTCDNGSQKEYKITVDEDCTVTFKCYCTGRTTIHTMYLIVNGVSSQYRGFASAWDTYTRTETLTAGSEAKLQIDNGGGDFVVVMEVSGMTNLPSDEPQDLDTKLFGHNVEEYLYTNCPQQALCYMGAVGNIGDFTVKELLTAICWQFGHKVVKVGGVLSFAQPTATKTLRNATLTAFEPVYDKLGQYNHVKRRDGNEIQWSIDNLLLSDNVTKDVDIYSKAVNASNLVGMNFLLAEIFSWEADLTDMPIKWEVSVEDIDGLVMGRLNTSNWKLYVLSTLSSLGLDELGKVALTTWQTYEDVSEYDYVFIDGHKYMIVDGTTDEETGLCEFRALEVMNVSAVRGRDFSDDFSDDFS